MTHSQKIASATSMLTLILNTAGGEMPTSVALKETARRYYTTRRNIRVALIHALKTGAVLPGERAKTIRLPPLSI